MHETQGVLISEHLLFCVAKINVAILPDTAPTNTASSDQFGILFSYIDNKMSYTRTWYKKNKHKLQEKYLERKRKREEEERKNRVQFKVIHGSFLIEFT